MNMDYESAIHAKAIILAVSSPDKNPQDYLFLRNTFEKPCTGPGKGKTT